MTIFRQNLLACLIAVSSLLLLSEAASGKKIDGDELLSADRLVEIKIEIAADDWKELCRQTRNPASAFTGLATGDPYSYFKADLWIDDEKISSVGVRKKGFIGSADTDRPSLKIKFDEYKDQSPIDGLSRLTLNNNKQDKSQASQYLSYKLFRSAGNPAPRSGWAHVVVNGESLGVYSNVESIKGPFLKREFEDKSGNLYEGTVADFYPKAIGSIEVKTNEDDNDLSEIKRLAAILSSEEVVNVEELEKIVDLDAFYRFWALESLTGFWDGYSANQNNYYVYFSPKNGHRATFIPWGADWVFTTGGPFARFGIGGSKVMYAQGILSNRLAHTDEGLERYKATMQRILDEFWDEDEMLAELDRIEKLVSPHLHSAQAETPKALNEIREFIRGRRESVQEALDHWPPEVPAEPRKPVYVVELGTAKGSFSGVFSDDDEDNQGKADLVVNVDGNPIEFDSVTVRAKPMQFSGFGGFSRGGAQGPPPVNLIITGERSDREPIHLSFLIGQEQFTPDSEDGFVVIGSYREGNETRGFGGFGGGYLLHGSLKFSKAGATNGDAVSGTMDLSIVETHGGLFDRRRSPRGGGGRPPREENR